MTWVDIQSLLHVLSHALCLGYLYLYLIHPKAQYRPTLALRKGVWCGLDQRVHSVSL